MESSLTITLRTVAMDTSRGVSICIQEVIECITPFLGLHEHQGESFRAWGGTELVLIQDGPSLPAREYLVTAGVLRIICQLGNI